MFGLLRKKEIRELYAPVKGKMIDIEAVPDSIFSSRMMGDGVAFVFDGNCIYAPCDSEVCLIPNTKHAIGLRTANDIEILIHIGLDTVNLKGEGFNQLKKVGDKVKKGDVLIKIDRSLMKEKNIDLITPMIITSKHKIEICDVKDVDKKTVVLKIV